MEATSRKFCCDTGATSNPRCPSVSTMPSEDRRERISRRVETLTP